MSKDKRLLPLLPQSFGPGSWYGIPASLAKIYTSVLKKDEATELEQETPSPSNELEPVEE
jgi:hypothetical protein